MRTIAMRAHAGPRAVGSLTRFVPPLLWMVLIALGSSSLLAGERTASWLPALLGRLAPWASPATLAAAHFGLRKLGHLLEFGILAVLWRRALAPSTRAVPVAFVVASLYAGVDEWRQGLTPDRVPAVGDVVIDALGALLGLAAWEGPGPLAARTGRAAAWALGLAAALGFLFVPLDLALGRPATALAVTALGLGVAAHSLARLARSARVRVSSGPRAPAPP
jgi:hypothetical protein